MISIKFIFSQKTKMYKNFQSRKKNEIKSLNMARNLKIMSIKCRARPMFSNYVAFQLTLKQQHNNYAIDVLFSAFQPKINAFFRFREILFFFFFLHRRTRCNPKENFHKMGQQTFEKGNSRFFLSFCMYFWMFAVFLFAINRLLFGLRR